MLENGIFTSRLNKYLEDIFRWLTKFTLIVYLEEKLVFLRNKMSYAEGMKQICFP